MVPNIWIKRDRKREICQISTPLSLSLALSAQNHMHPKNFESAKTLLARGGRGGEISRSKTRETINYFIVNFITINEKVLINPNFAGINFKDISSHF